MKRGKQLLASLLVMMLALPALALAEDLLWSDGTAITAQQRHRPWEGKKVRM